MMLHALNLILLVRVTISMMKLDVGWLVGDVMFGAEAANGAEINSIVMRRNVVRFSLIYGYLVDSIICVKPIVFKENEANNKYGSENLDYKQTG